MEELEERTWQDDLPWVAAAVLTHAVILAANPVILRGRPAAEKLIPVELVAMVPSPNLAPVPAGDGSNNDKLPDPGPGPVTPAKIKKGEPKPAAVKAARKADPQARARRLAARAADREKALEIAALRAEKARAAAEQRVRQARRRVELSRELAALTGPGEFLDDGAAAPAGTAKARQDMDMPTASDSGGSAGEDLRDRPVSGGGDKRVAGGLSWSIEGPVGNRRLLARQIPRSPDWVSSRGLNLAVRIKFQVLADGTVKGALIKLTSGFPELDTLALTALAKWRFEALAAALAKVPDTWGLVTFRFTMG